MAWHGMYGIVGHSLEKYGIVWNSSRSTAWYGIVSKALWYGMAELGERTFGALEQRGLYKELNLG